MLLYINTFRILCFKSCGLEILFRHKSGKHTLTLHLVRKMNRADIISTLSQHQALLKSHGIERIGLFGSFVRDEQKETSDIDLLVQFSKDKKSLHNLVSLGDELEKLFGRDVELVTTESLSKYIGPHILNEVQYAPLYN